MTTFAVSISGLEVESIFDPVQVRGFDRIATQLIGDELGTLRPELFLNSISQGPWCPRVLVIRRDGAITGLIFTKELKVAGLRMGLICADATYGPIIACKPNDLEAVWSSAVSYLLGLKTVLGIRLAIPSSDYGLYAQPAALRQFGAAASDTKYSANAILELPASYEELLGQMGKHTRRNFRYYRRQFEANGHAYAAALTDSEFCEATHQLLGKSSISGEKERLELDVSMCLAADRPLLIGLRSQNGEWLAVLGGWYHRGQVTVRFQMNRDQEHRADSLSVVLRGYLIESLIQRGFQSIVFVRGVSEPLNRLCRIVPTIILYLDKHGSFFKPAHLLNLVARLTPQRFAPRALWLANPGLRENPELGENPALPAQAPAIIPSHDQFDPTLH